jgi:hypothetical protein
MAERVKAAHHLQQLPAVQGPEDDAPEDARAQHGLAGQHLPAAVTAHQQQGKVRHRVVVQVAQPLASPSWPVPRQRLDGAAAR